MHSQNNKIAHQIDFDLFQNHIDSVHRYLQQSSDFSPRNPKINSLLTELFYMTTHLIENETIKAHLAFVEKILFLKEFRDLLAKTEEAMEYYWAEKLGNDPEYNYNSLSKFIYWKNYSSLVEKEYALLKQHANNLSVQSCFIGQGPLPISMLIYQKMTNAQCIGIDISKEAICASCTLITTADNCTCVHIDGADYDYTNAPVIFIASMVPDKDIIMNKIKQDRKGKPTFIMVRTAENLSEIYYEPYTCYDPEMVLLGKTDYCCDTINTTLLYRYN
jgi:hypothetical protein